MYLDLTFQKVYAWVCVEVEWVSATPPSAPYSYTLWDELPLANNYFPFSKCV